MPPLEVDLTFTVELLTPDHFALISQLGDSEPVLELVPWAEMVDE